MQDKFFKRTTMKTLLSYFASLKRKWASVYKIIRPLRPLPFFWAMVPVKIEDACSGKDKSD